MIEVDRREKVTKDEYLYPLVYSAAQLRNPPIRAIEIELPYGDFRWQGNGRDDIPHLVGVERKTIPDLIGCIHDGRFAGHQLPGLTSSYNSLWVVVEGEFRRGPTGELLVRRGRDWAPPPGQPIRYSGVSHWITTLEVCTGARVAFTPDTQATIAWVLDLYNWWQTPWEEHRSHLAFDDSNELRELVQTSVPTLLRRIAKELPGIGWVRSKLVEQRFGTVYDMISAGPQEWVKIEGVGKLTAKRVFEAMRTKGFR